MYHGFIILFTLLLSVSLRGQSPLITQYPPSQYKGNGVNWMVTQAPNGRIFLSNNSGILTYDGRRWRLIPVPGKNPRGMAMYQERLFFGTNNSIGYINTNDPSLEPIYLNHLLPKGGSEIKTVFAIFVVGKSLFIENQKTIFEFDVETLAFKGAHESPEFVTACYPIGEKMYILGEENIFLLEEGVFKPIRSIYFADEFILTLLPHPNGGALAVGEFGALTHFPNGLQGEGQLFQQNQLKAIPELNLYLGGIINKNLAKDSFFLFTTSHGLVEINSKGEVLNIFDLDAGALSNIAYTGIFDSEGNIWIAGTNGISHIMYSQSTTMYQNAPWKNITVHTTHQSGENFYVGANNGLFIQKPNKSETFKPLINDQIWQIEAFVNNSILVASGNSGLSHIRDDKVLQIFRTPISTRSLLVSPTSSNEVYLGLYDGAMLVEYKNGKISKKSQIKDIEGDVRTIVADRNNDIWFGTTVNGIFKLHIDGKDSIVTHFDTSSGLCDDEHNFVFSINNELFGTCRQGLHKYNFKTRRFSRFKWGINHPEFYPKLRQLENGNIVSLTDKVILNSDFTVLDSLSLKNIEGDLIDIQLADGNILLASSVTGLYKIEMTENSNPESLPEILTEVFYDDGGRRIFFNLLRNEITIPKEIPEFTVRFSLPSYNQENNFRYRYIMEGYHDSWRPFGTYTELTYSDVTPNSYTFRIQAIDSKGAITPVYSGLITVEPKWYQTWWARTSFGLLIASLIYFLVWINNYRLIRRNEYLVNLVDSRTEEIRQQNIQLSHQAEEINRINEMRGRLTRVAVHDLRNPLHILEGYLDLLSEPDAEAEQLRNHMGDVLSRMLEKINQLLDIDQNGFVKSDAQKENISVTDIVVETIQNNNILARKKNQSIESEILSDIEMVANPGKLSEIFDNIINNAIKYSPLNSKITVHLSKISNDSFPQLLFKVSDEGFGISESYMDKIFQPYTTGDIEPTGGEYSTGLGLSIVKQYVEELNGTISCLNRENGRGAVFIITIPLLR